MRPVIFSLELSSVLGFICEVVLGAALTFYHRVGM